MTKRFGDVTAVDDVDLEVGAGEFFSLLGPSGCGKTTTVRLMLGLYAPQKGAMRVLGRLGGNTLRALNWTSVGALFWNVGL